MLAGVPTVYLLIYNGMLLGAFTALHHRAGIYTDYWAWILPHGVTEISAIVLCGGVGLLLGKSVLSPGELTRTESLRRAGNEAVPVCLGIAGMLVLAAIIESYLRQSHLSPERVPPDFRRARSAVSGLDQPISWRMERVRRIRVHVATAGDGQRIFDCRSSMN